jgi:mannitol/fructose-specific phosphotransferase system IIA component (Ntr-type)
MTCRIAQYTSPSKILPALAAASKEGVLREIALHAAKVHSEVDSDELFQKLQDRELKASTGADHGLAIPHATLFNLDELTVVVARSPSGVDFGSLDNQASHLFFAVLNPQKVKPGEITYLQAISAICRFMRQPTVRQRLIEAPDADAMFRIIATEETPRSAV